MIASYFAILLVHQKSNLAMYLSLMLDSEGSIAAIPAPEDP
jgi:hypothetical protein